MSNSKKNAEVAVIEPVKELTKRQKTLATTVTLLASANPKKKGSMSYERFEGYFKLTAGATVADALKVGVRMDDIRHDSEHGFIQVGDAPVANREMQAGDL